MILKPCQGLLTKEIFGALRLDRVARHPDTPGAARAMERGDADALIRCMGNVLETVAVPRQPEIEKAMGELMDLGARHARMSGSGSAVFGLFDSLGGRRAGGAAAENPLCRMLCRRKRNLRRQIHLKQRIKLHRKTNAICRKGGRRREALVFLLIFALLCAGLYGWGAAQPTDLQRAAHSGDLVRIHILAHDDSERQQAVKLRVRDAILEAFTPLLQKAESAADAARIVERHLDLAQETAEKTLQEENDPLQVRVEFGTFDFPERVYGGQVVPAGEYRALRILLGDGAGKNWWCVMYPPLCFPARM